MLLLGFNALQEEVLNAQLNGGKQSKHGLILNALMTGVVESFQGKYFGNNEAANVWTISAGASIDKDLEPYYLQGSSQEFAVRVSDTTAVTTAGILDASVAGDRGYLRLSLRDVNGKAAMALTQENVRWIAPLTSFTAVFDIAKWTTSAYGKRSLSSKSVSWGPKGPSQTSPMQRRNPATAIPSSQFSSPRTRASCAFVRRHLQRLSRDLPSCSLTPQPRRSPFGLNTNTIQKQLVDTRFSS